MKLPRLFAACDDCWENAPEQGCHYPGAIGWSHMHQKWLCAECWEEFDTAERTVPLVYAKDLLPTGEEQMQRLVAAAAKQRMGVK
jgi:hypothetical protein